MFEYHLLFKTEFWEYSFGWNAIKWFFQVSFRSWSRTENIKRENGSGPRRSGTERHHFSNCLLQTIRTGCLTLLFLLSVKKTFKILAWSHDYGFSFPLWNCIRRRFCPSIPWKGPSVPVRVKRSILKLNCRALLHLPRLFDQKRGGQKMLKILERWLKEGRWWCREKRNKRGICVVTIRLSPCGRWTLNTEQRMNEWDVLLL